MYEAKVARPDHCNMIPTVLGEYFAHDDHVPIGLYSDTHHLMGAYPSGSRHVPTAVANTDVRGMNAWAEERADRQKAKGTIYCVFVLTCGHTLIQTHSDPEAKRHLLTRVTRTRRAHRQDSGRRGSVLTSLHRKNLANGRDGAELAPELVLLGHEQEVHHLALASTTLS